MDAQLHVFVGRKRHVKTTKIDLDSPEVVHIQGHWITIQQQPSIYQARQLFNMKSNESKLKCQEAGEMT